MTTATALTTQTPVEIDTRLAEISEKFAIAQMRADQYGKLAAEAIAKGEYWAKYHAPDYAKTAAEYQSTADALAPEIAALNGEFTARGGWTRAFLAVTNGSGGHVHRNRSCTSCYVTTEYAWMTEFSGQTEAEIVDAAGERACTYCYPSAPVEVLDRPTRMFTKDEQRIAAERAERAAKKDAAAAATVCDAETGEVIYKTERAALNAASAALDDTLWYGGHPDDAKWERIASRAVAAVAAKNGTDPVALRAELDAKAAKKFTAKVRKIVKENTPHAWNYCDPQNFMPSIKAEAQRLGLI